MDLVNGGQAGASDELSQLQSHLYKTILSFIDSMSLYSAIQLRIPDIIHNHGQPITLKQLVSKLRIHPQKTSCMQRLMRLLVHSGFITKTTAVGVVHEDQEEEEEEAYALTVSSRIVLEDKVTGLSPLVQTILDPAVVNSWYCWGDWFRGPELTPFVKTHGMGFFDYCNQNPGYGVTFDEGMASDSRLMSKVIKDYKTLFEGLDSLVDVGGGSGTASRIISEAFPHLKCTVFDLPHVVADLPDDKNLKYVGGDMFQSIPAADAILMKWILHDWNDDECINILKKCKEAIRSNGKDGKIIIIDVVINEEEEQHDVTKAKLFLDALMMILFNGKERTKKEWEKLFLDAGFSHYKVVAPYGLKSLIELYPN